MRTVLALVLLATLLVGCHQTTSTTTAPVAFGTAAAVEGWDDVNNVFRDGEVYFAGQPQPSALRRFADAGVELVVNLRTPPEMERLEFDEPALVESLGMRYVHIPVTPDSMSAGDVERLAEALDGRDGPVLIHCGSSNRVGSLWAAYLARVRGLEVDDAITRGRAAGLRADAAVEAARRVATAP